MIPGWDMIIIGMNPYSIFEGEGFRTRSGHLLEMVISLKKRGSLYYAYPDRGGYGILDRGGLALVDLSSCSLSQLVKREGLKKVIFWLYHPLLVDHIPKEMGILVFDAVDDLREHSSFSSCREEIEKKYRKIKEEAHLIFTVSKALAEVFSREKGWVYPIKNGVPEDFLVKTYKPLEELRGLEPPIIGYVGVMEGRFDVELIKMLARSLEKGTILLVGPIWEGLEELKGEERIKFLGFRPYSQVPSIIQSFQVALVPHLVNSLTESMDPIKLYEYLAFGCPIVSTKVAGAKDLEDVVEVADSREDFVAAVKEVIKEPGLASGRRLVAKRHTWEQRILTIQKILKSRVALMD